MSNPLPRPLHSSVARSRRIAFPRASLRRTASLDDIAIPPGPSHEAGNPGLVGVRAGGPARIVAIGTDHVEVSIGPIFEQADITAVVARIEQLLEAGYDTVDIVSTPTPSDPVPLAERLHPDARPPQQHQHKGTKP